MSNVKLHIFPEKLYGAASILACLDKDTSRIQQSLGNIWFGLDAGWDGYSGVDVSGIFNQAQDGLERTTLTLGQVGPALQKVADWIVGSDQNAAALFAGLGLSPTLDNSYLLNALFDTPPISPELWEYAQQAGEEFGVPPEFVAAVLAAEQEHDYTLQDQIEDTMALAALVMIESQKGDWRYTTPTQGLQGWLILTAIETVDLSLGVGQVRLSTARGVAEYVARHPELGLSDEFPTDLSTRDLVARLESPKWNTRYVAGYLRQLADMRGTEDFTVEEMQIIYGAYRTGPGALDLAQPGPIGSELSPEVIEYYRDLLSE